MEPGIPNPYQQANPNQYNPLIITDDIKGFLMEFAKWAKFLAIVGYIGIGLMVLGALIMLLVAMTSGGYGSGQAAGIAFVYLVMAVVYFFPIQYLHRSATGIRDAIQTNNQYSLSTGFQYLKSHYKFVGIMLIIILSLYALILVFGLLMVGLR